MIVMLMIVEMLVPCNAVRQIDLARQSAIGENLHRPIHGRVPHTRIFRPYDTVNVLHAPMAFVFEENIQNELTMGSDFEFSALQVFEEYLHLRSKNLHGVGCVGGINLTTSL